eukprot:TRINITY_DN15755_c0_g1_i1.p1 TRINITY_DN15755_c0_g1~~TRINITY_DN15755_c0_g1_i1.p1  ORF type:complete len:208 (+),score=32.33 TRINITY_DN15755_c0_g1_i1:43-624(+)
MYSIAFKNVVASRRTAWRSLCNAEIKAENEHNEFHIKIVKDYKQTIKKELLDLYQDALSTLDRLLSAPGISYKSKFFYIIMKGDIYNYLVEISDGESKIQMLDKSLELYRAAIFMPEFTSTNVDRLSLGLRISLKLFDMSRKEEACALAKEVFDLAILELDKLSDDSFKEVVVLLELLKNNINEWNGAAKVNT